MRRTRQDAVASDAIAEEAALALLAAGGSALAAALAGFFAAAGASPGILLGPLSVLMGGVGQGARAFDGRLRQPGLGTRRPRGFPPESEVPAAASVAAPVALHAAIVAHAYASGATLAAVVRPGIDSALASGAADRARLLERVAAVGAAALVEPAFQRPLLHAGSTSEGGLITPKDLEAKSDIDVAASPLAREPERWLAAPWAEKPAPGSSVGRGRGICAADAHGGLVALAYRETPGGVPIEELGLVAPLASVPVRRGVPRVAPGAALAAPFAAALGLDEQRRPVEVSIEPDSDEFEPQQVRSPRLTLLFGSETRFVTRRTQ